MRFLFFDRIVQIEKGRSIEGIKAFSLSEEFLQEHFTRIPLIPGVVYVEAMAQLLGWLIIYSHDFQYLPILSIVEDVKVMADLCPGFKAHIQAEILSTTETDSLGKAEVHIDGEPIAKADRMIYSHFDSPDPEALLRQFEYFCHDMNTQTHASGRSSVIV